MITFLIVLEFFDWAITNRKFVGNLRDVHVILLLDSNNHKLFWTLLQGLAKRAFNGPFAASGHMVQNPPCWRASCPLGHPEQSDFIKTNLHFLCCGCPSA